MKARTNDQTNVVERGRTNDPDANPDLITKAPGSHPIGTGVGAIIGGGAVAGGAIAAGAAMGSVVGPIGTAVGAAIGAVAGGLIGKDVAEGINPSVEHAYWRSNYSTRPYADPSTPYEQYGPAYQYGWESQTIHSNAEFDDVDDELAQDWEKRREQSKLNWEKARPAARDAWERVRSRADVDESE